MSGKKIVISITLKTCAPSQCQIRKLGWFAVVQWVKLGDTRVSLVLSLLPVRHKIRNFTKPEKSLIDNFEYFLDEYVQLCGSRPGQVKNPMTNVTEEIDECALMPEMCNHGECINTPGSFHCVCDPGYVYDEFAHQCIGILYSIVRSCTNLSEVTKKE